MVHPSGNDRPLNPNLKRSREEGPGARLFRMTCIMSGRRRLAGLAAIPIGDGVRVFAQMSAFTGLLCGLRRRPFKGPMTLLRLCFVYQLLEARTDRYPAVRTQRPAVRVVLILIRHIHSRCFPNIATGR